jgi:hypothetical protein
MNSSSAIWWRHLPVACSNFFEAGVSGNISPCMYYENCCTYFCPEMPPPNIWASAGTRTRQASPRSRTRLSVQFSKRVLRSAVFLTNGNARLAVPYCQVQFRDAPPHRPVLSPSASLGRDSPKLLNVAAWQLLNQLGSKILLRFPFAVGRREVGFNCPIFVIHQFLCGNCQ